jgi:hypothetical protein
LNILDTIAALAKSPFSSNSMIKFNKSYGRGSGIPPELSVDGALFILKAIAGILYISFAGFSFS